MSRPARNPDDIAYVHLSSRFDFIDRVRILFGREPQQRVAVSVWFPEPARPYMHAESEVSVFVPRIFPQRNPPMMAPIDGAATAQNLRT